jgi:hypothetical protein
MINKEINEFRTKIDNIKEDTTQDMENLRKKIETETLRRQRPIGKGDQELEKRSVQEKLI